MGVAALATQQAHFLQAEGGVQARPALGAREEECLPVGLGIWAALSQTAQERSSSSLTVRGQAFRRVTDSAPKRFPT